MKNKKGFAPIVLIIGVVVVLAIGGGIYVVLKMPKFSPNGMAENQEQVENKFNENDKNLLPVNIISPNGEEVWKIGESHEFKVRVAPGEKLGDISGCLVDNFYLEIFDNVAGTKLDEFGFGDENRYNNKIKDKENLIFVKNFKVPERINVGLETIDFSDQNVKYKIKSRILCDFNVLKKPGTQIDSSDILLYGEDESDGFFRIISNTEKQIGYIKAVYEKDGKRYLDIDYIQMFSGEEAINEAIKDTGCIRDKVSECVASLNNGFYIKNQNSLIRTFEISQNAQIKRTSVFQNNPSGEKDINYQEFKGYFVAGSQEVHLKNIPFHIEIFNGIIQEIAEQFIP